MVYKLLLLPFKEFLLVVSIFFGLIRLSTISFDERLWSDRRLNESSWVGLITMPSTPEAITYSAPEAIISPESSFLD